MVFLSVCVSSVYSCESQCDGCKCKVVAGPTIAVGPLQPQPGFKFTYSKYNTYKMDTGRRRELRWLEAAWMHCSASLYADIKSAPLLMWTPWCQGQDVVTQGSICYRAWGSKCVPAALTSTLSGSSDTYCAVKALCCRQ